MHAAQPRLPIILITAFGTTQTAIEAIKFGAYDYLLKPFEIPQLLDLIRRAVDSNRLMSEPVTLGEPGAARDAIVGQGAAMQALYKEIGRIAGKPVNAPRSWPNNSLSNKVSGIAAQLIATNGASARSLCW